MTSDQILQGFSFFNHTGKGRKDISVKEKNIDSLYIGSTSALCRHFRKVLCVCLTTSLISEYLSSMCQLPGTMLDLDYTIDKISPLTSLYSWGNMRGLIKQAITVNYDQCSNKGKRAVMSEHREGT